MKVKTVSIDADVEAVLREAKLEGNNLTLQGQLTPQMYKKVMKVLETLGFQWNKKAKCHIGEGDSADKLREGLEGGKVVNEKQTYQFFETPEQLAEKMVSAANIGAKDTVLEPSAGKGAIVKAIQRSVPGINVYVCELEPKMNQALDKMPRVAVLGTDFLMLENRLFSRIVMNPPFTAGQDIEHVRHAYRLLAPGGRIVAITSQSWLTNTNKKSVAFREWIKSLEDQGFPVGIETIEGGTFKESGTMVGTMMLTIMNPR